MISTIACIKQYLAASLLTQPCFGASIPTWFLARRIN